MNILIADPSAPIIISPPLISAVEIVDFPQSGDHARPLLHLLWSCLLERSYPVASSTSYSTSTAMATISGTSPHAPFSLSP